jgi:hypothetical protein
LSTTFDMDQQAQQARRNAIAQALLATLCERTGMNPDDVMMGTTRQARTRGLSYEMTAGHYSNRQMERGAPARNAHNGGRMNEKGTLRMKLQEKLMIKRLTQLAELEQ